MQTKPAVTFPPPSELLQAMEKKKAMADPEFPIAAAPTTKVGAPTFYFGQFSPKTT